VHVFVVEGLDVDGGDEGLPEAGRGVLEQVAEYGEVVEEFGVGGGRGGGEFGELGVDGGAFVFEFGEPGQDAAAQGGDGAGVGVGAVVGEGFGLAGVGVLGGLDLA